MGNSVTVSVNDMPPWTIKEIEKFTGKFKSGHFDGMTDMYEYSNNDSSIPQTKYLSVNNEFSDELKQEAWQFVLNSFGGFSDAPMLYKDAGSYYSDKWQEYGSNIIYRVLNGSYGYEDFWKSKKPHLKLAA